MTERDIVVNTAEAATRLKSLQEFTTVSVNPDVAEFARFLAGRLKPKVAPMEFIMAAELSIYDLQKGVNGFTGEPIESSLVGRIPETYALLRTSVPKLASIAISQEFADAVKDIYQKLIG